MLMPINERLMRQYLDEKIEIFIVTIAKLSQWVAYMCQFIAVIRNVFCSNFI